MEYHFNNTSAFPGVHFSLEFSSTNCKADLIHVKSRDTDHFYRIFLQEDNIITFSNKLEDGEFNISVSLSGKQTFCDGEKHRVEFNRYGAILSSKADGEKEYRHKEPGIRKVIFSKPDKVVIGGISETKFDGCIHKAIVLFYWKRDLKNISINLLAQYLKGDSRVRYADVFLGACPDKRQECTRSKNINYIKSGDGLIVSPRKKEEKEVLLTNVRGSSVLHTISDSDLPCYFTILIHLYHALKAKLLSTMVTLLTQTLLCDSVTLNRAQWSTREEITW